jgi:hypothetical protein
MKGADKLLLKRAEEISKMQRHMGLTVDPLYADLNFAFEQWLKDKGNQFWRRTLIRCLLAVLEALLWNMKNMIPKVSAISGVQLTADELAIATEVRVTVKNGKTEERKKFLPFPDNLKATFALYAKIHKATYSLNGSKDFDALCKTYDLRSRLMHPKRPFDPQVSDDDIRRSQDGMKWLMNEYATLIAACSAGIAGMTKS